MRLPKRGRKAERIGGRELSHIRFRMSQNRRETTIQRAVDPAITTQGFHLVTDAAMSRPKANRPMLPIAVPAASIATTARARLAPPRPARCFFSFSCLSIRVALAGKIAGKARNRPPTAGPYFLPMIPVAAVMSPPTMNRVRSSYQRVCLRGEGSRMIRTLFYLNKAYQRPNAMAPQIGNRQMVTVSALWERRIMMQLTLEE